MPVAQDLPPDEEDSGTAPGDPIGSVPTRRPWRLRYWFAAAYAVALGLAAWWYETPDAARHRRLAQIHQDRAASCRRAAGFAERAGHPGEAVVLRRRARDHDRLAAAHRDQARPWPG